MTRVCLDSNVFVAAFAARGLCADLLSFVIAEYHLVVPEVVIDETLRVLKGKLKADPTALAAVQAVFDRCEIIPRGTDPSPIPVRDPDDERVLADAHRGAADFLVTGDQDLLAVAEISPLRILSPRGFLTLARGGTL